MPASVMHKNESENFSILTGEKYFLRTAVADANSDPKQIIKQYDSSHKRLEQKVRQIKPMCNPNTFLINKHFSVTCMKKYQ